MELSIIFAVDGAFLFPVKDHEEAEQHSAEMGEVGHVVAGIHSDAFKQFDGTVSDDHPFGFDAHGDEHNVDEAVGEQHTESEEDTVDTTGCSDSGLIEEDVERTGGRIGVIHASEKD